MKKIQISKFTDAPQQIQKTHFINAPIEKVWEVVADHKGMTQWMPMILVKGHLGHIELIKEGNGTKVNWTQYFYPNGNFIKRFMAKNVMMPSVMSKALKNLNKKVA